MRYDMMAEERRPTRLEELAELVGDAVQDFYSFLYPANTKALRPWLLETDPHGERGIITLRNSWPASWDERKDEMLTPTEVLTNYLRQRLAYNVAEESSGFIWADELAEAGRRIVEEKDVIRFVMFAGHGGPPILEGFSWGSMDEYAYLRALAEYLANDWMTSAQVRWDNTSKRFYVLVLYQDLTANEVLRGDIKTAVVACTPYDIDPRWRGRIVGEVVVRRFSGFPEQSFATTLYSKI